MARTTRHHYHSPVTRGFLAFVLIASMLLIGTIGLHGVEGMSYLDAFYFMSMIATAQGPATAPVTAAGKIFTAVMAFISVGSVAAAGAFLFGPFFGKLWRIGSNKFEEELRQLRDRSAR